MPHSFYQKMQHGNITSQTQMQLPQLGMMQLPNRAIQCPQCKTTFVAGNLEACSFCDWKEGRVPEEGWKSLEYRNS